MRHRLAIVLLLAVEAFCQQAKSRPVVNTNVGFLVHGDDTTGKIHGEVTHDGKPEKGIRVTAQWLCEEACFSMASTVITNEAGEFRFEPITFGHYSVFAGTMFDLLPLPNSAAPIKAPLKYEEVELSPDHSDAYFRFEAPVFNKK